MFSAIYIQSSPTLNTKVDAVFARWDNYQALLIEWLSGNWTEMLIAIGIALVFYAVLLWLRHFAARFVEKRGEGSDLATIAAKAIARTSRFFRIMFAIELVKDLSNAPASVARVITTVFIIALVIQIAIWLREIVLGLIERRLGQSQQPHETLSSAIILIRWLVSSVIFAIAILVILDNLGINITGLVAGLGVGGIAIGLAAQGIFADLFAAIAMIFDKPFVRGDTIKFDTTTATVESIGIKSTRLRALSGEEVVFANRLLLDKEITNFTQMERRRITFLFGLVCQTSSVKALALPALLDEAVTTGGAEFLRSGFIGFGASALDFELVFDIHSPDFAVIAEHRHRIGIAVLQVLRDAGYELAYPTQTTFTADPEGTMIMPYATPLAAAPSK